MTLTQPFISAASGLVELEGKYYVIADDEHFLGAFDPTHKSGKSIVIFKDQLPEEHKARKKQKADFESLVYLKSRHCLLAIPSGSEPNRIKGALIDPEGKWIEEFSFQELYVELTQHFPELNIEGGAVYENELWLWQRGNGSLHQNGLIRMQLDHFLSGKITILSIRPVQLGRHANINISFTDGCITDNGIFFLATAEDTSSTYLDGQIHGSFLGMMDASGNILVMEQLAIKSKPEGLCLKNQSSCFYLVTDDDDRSKPASLWEGSLPSAWKSFLVL